MAFVYAYHIHPFYQALNRDGWMSVTHMNDNPMERQQFAVNEDNHFNREFIVKESWELLRWNVYAN
ncbi:hypothetical protein NQ117_21665 [Paenibacillus sp. SC116]|uniref:hypothetical protein n=1 Tax=Paenibacillus sp. SC116 TaxID=2968986 RepID=UPI00215B522A|nr:hypothetical protein [Paenibacillus sp. SC116]MCR8846297.1 hypothetical protein [Paenibacillus sp. SC116]